MTEADRMVADYLRRLRRAARGLPRAARRELVAEIATHIAEARATGAATAGPAAGSPTGPPGRGDVPREPDIGAILARLGDPADIARAAGAPASVTRPGALEIASVILLLIGGFVFLIGWVAGCVLLWVSPRWTWADKLLGTLVWPGGLAAPVLLGGMAAYQAAAAPCVATGPGLPPGTPATCGGQAGPPAWTGITLLVVTVIAPVAVAAWLLWRARRLPRHQPAATHP